MATVDSAGTIRVDDSVIAEAVRKAASDEILRLIRQGAILDELMIILNSQCFRQKDLWVAGVDASDWVVVHRNDKTGEGRGRLFRHPSLIAAVEFALKWQPEESPKQEG